MLSGRYGRNCSGVPRLRNQQMRLERSTTGPSGACGFALFTCDAPRQTCTSWGADDVCACCSPKKKNAVVRTAAAAPKKKSVGRRERAVAVVPVRQKNLRRVSTRRRRGVEARPVAPAVELTAEGAPRKATSDDFVKAAAGKTDEVAAEAPKPVEAEKSAVVAPAASRAGKKNVSVAASVSVVSVIRPTTEKAQLESVEEAAASPVILPSLYNKRGRLIVPPPLKGSHEILVRQNVVADHDGLDRVQNDDDLDLLREQRLLVALPSSSNT